MYVCNNAIPCYTYLDKISLDSLLNHTCKPLMFVDSRISFAVSPLRILTTPVNTLGLLYKSERVAIAIT